MNLPIPYETIRDLCLEVDQDHWITNEDVDLNGADEVIELIQTGSVTTYINGKAYVVELVIREAIE